MAYAGSKVNLSCFDLIKQLPDLKKECPWLKEVNSHSLRAPIQNLDNAFTRFFKGKSDFPRFKRKSLGGSFNAGEYARIEDDRLVILKFRGGIRIVLHRPLEGRIKQVAITKTATGKYFASIICDTGGTAPVKQPIKEKTTVGIDLGLKSFLVSSDGEEFDNPRYLRKTMSKLKYVQRKYSKHKGKRTRKKLALIHEKVANQRKDFLHKTSAHLVKNHDTIAIENLNVAGMVKNHCLALSISDAGWNEFTRQLKYKADWQGKNILEIGRFEPSSKTCSCCGAINRELKLSEREWACQSCGSILNRDFNAALNIKNFALRNFSTGGRVKSRKKLPTLVGAVISGVTS